MLPKKHLYLCGDLLRASEICEQFSLAVQGISSTELLMDWRITAEAVIQFLPVLGCFASETIKLGNHLFYQISFI